jgi:hypothetical protein
MDVFFHAIFRAADAYTCSVSAVDKCPQVRYDLQSKLPYFSTTIFIKLELSEIYSLGG